MSEERPNYRGRRILAVVLALFILIVAIGVPVAILKPVPAANAVVSVTPVSSTAAADPDFPEFGSAAIGAVGMKGVLATEGPQTARPIASITKIVTALTVLQKKPITGSSGGPTITFTDADVTILNEVLADDGSYAPVQAGWKLTERQALETMLLPSANNYAESLAIWAYGSVPKYLTAASAFLRAHGLTHTSLVDTNGLGTGDQSTPTDLVELGRLALASPVVASIVSMQTATEPQVGLITNTNDLLGDDGIDGIKTGTTTPAGACLLFSAPVTVGSRTVQLIGVILNASTHAELDPTVPPLLASVAKGLHDLHLSTTHQVIATYRTAWGSTAKAEATADSSVLVWSKQKVVESATLTPIASGTKGQRVGTLHYSVDGKSVSVPLALDRRVLDAPIWWRLTHPFR